MPPPVTCKKRQNSVKHAQKCVKVFSANDTHLVDVVRPKGHQDGLDGPDNPDCQHVIVGVCELVPGQSRAAGAVSQEGVLCKLVQATEQTKRGDKLHELRQPVRAPLYVLDQDQIGDEAGDDDPDDGQQDCVRCRKKARCEFCKI